MTSDENKLEILKKVQDGTLTVEEGADLIGILDRAKTNEQQQSAGQIPPVEPVDVVTPEPPRVSSCWKAAWSMILLGGAVLTAFSAYWMYQGYEKAGLGWGFWLSWIPFMIGLLLIIFGWILMESPWLHVRVQSHEDNKPKKIAFSMPLPLQLATWVFRHFGSYMPREVQEKGVEDMLKEVEVSLKRGDPFQVEVEDNDDGDKVYINISK